jgi:hypothetical protein
MHPQLTYAGDRQGCLRLKSVTGRKRNNGDLTVGAMMYQFLLLTKGSVIRPDLATLYEETHDSTTSARSICVGLERVNSGNR